MKMIQLVISAMIVLSCLSLQEFAMTTELEYKFNFQINDYTRYETAGALYLHFDQKETSTFKFIVKAKCIPKSETDLTVYYPTDQDTSDFDLEMMSGELPQFSLFFNKKTLPTAEEDEYLMILLKFDTPPTSTKGYLNEKKPEPLEFASQLYGQYPISMIASGGTISLPHYVKIDLNTLANKKLILYSEMPFNVYDDNLLYLKTASNVNFHLLKKVTYSTFILEFFSSTIDSTLLFYQLMDSPVLFNMKDPNYGSDIPIQCPHDTFNLKQFYMYSFKDKMAEGTQWLYLKKEYGVFDIKYHAFDKVNSDDMIIPTTLIDFTVPIKLEKPNFMFEVTCAYGGYYPINFIQQTVDYTVHNYKTVLLFMTGTTDVSLINAQGRNLEIRIIQNTASAAKSSEISVNYNDQDLSFVDNALRIQSVNSQKLIINNPFDAAVIEFRIGMTFTEVTGNEGIELNAKYIYYKLSSERGISYHFEFNKQLNDEYKIDYGYGVNGYLPRPIQKPDYNYGVISHYRNPLFGIGASNQDNFDYIAFEIPDGEMPYSFNVKMYYDKYSDADLMTQKAILGLDKIKISLHSSKNNANSKLAVFLSRTNALSTSLKLSYITKEYTAQPVTNQLEVLEFTNEYHPYDLQYLQQETKETLVDYCMSYNYISATDALSSIRTVLAQQKKTFTYTPLTGKLTWESPDASITKFRIYVSQVEGDDLSNECKLFKKANAAYKEVDNVNEFKLSEIAPNLGDYEVNILAISGESIIPYMIAYQQQKVTVTTIEVASLGEPETAQRINFNTNAQYSFYIEVPAAEVNSEGVITLVFDNAMTAQDETQFQFKAKIVQLSDEEDKGVSLPQDGELSQFEVKAEQQKFYRMYYQIKVDPIDPNKKIYILIKAKFPAIFASEAEMSYSKVSQSIELASFQPVRGSIYLKKNIPKFIKLIKKPSSTSNTVLLASDNAFNCYTNNISKDNKPNTFELLDLKIIEKDDINTYIIEYFEYFTEETKFVQIHSEPITNTFKLIKPEEFNNYHYSCASDSSILLVSSFRSISSNSDYDISFNNLNGKFNVYFVNHFLFFEEVKTIIPAGEGWLFTEMKSLINPFFIMNIECIFEGEFNVKILKPKKASYTLIDNIESVFLESGVTTITLPTALTGEKPIEFRFIQKNSNANYYDVNDINDNSVVIEVKPGETYTLTEENKVVRIPNVEATTLAITNQFEIVALDIAIGSSELIEAKGDGESLTSQFIYYKMNAPRATKYTFTFNKAIDTTFKYYTGIGEEGFIPKFSSSSAITVNVDGVSFDLANPYSTAGGLLTNEFWYIAIIIPGDYALNTYTLTVQPDITVDPNKILAVNKFHELNEQSILLGANKDPQLKKLVVCISQCEKADAEVKLFYRSKKVATFTPSLDKVIFNIDNDNLPLNVEFSGSQNLLSYNYLTDKEFEDLVKIDSMVITYETETRKIIWKSPDFKEGVKYSYKLYLLKESDTTIINNECNLNKLVETAKVDVLEYTVPDKTEGGDYKVNILADINTPKLQYYFSYIETKIKIEAVTPGPKPDPEEPTTTPVWVWVVVAIGIIVIFAVVFLVLYFRRKKKLALAEQQFSQLIAA